MQDSHITLYLPDLAASVRAAPEIRLPILEKILGRASARPLADGTMVLAEQFGLPSEEFPVAAIERLGRGAAAEPGFWWRADPVPLLVDRDQVAMLPRSVLDVTADEARALIATFNEAYAADGFVLEALCPDAWYLRVPRAWHCRSWDPARVEGWAITEFMPAGRDEDSLRKLMNEIQMLFYEHPVNQERERHGRLAINSLWLWGGGQVPEQTGTAPARVVSNLPLLRGLAMLGGGRCEPMSGRLPLWAGAGNMLVATTLRDYEGDLRRLDTQLLKPCWRALLRGRAGVLECFPGGAQVYRVTRRVALRFWRRAGSPLAILDEADVRAPH